MGEPECSKFHYEEQTLHKLVRLEFQVEQMVKETQSVLSDMRAEMVAIRKERDELRTMVETSQRNMSKTLTDMSEWRNSLANNMEDFKSKAMTELKDLATVPTVGFVAKDPADNSPATNQVIIFKTVLENIGNGYDATTGKFMAPVQGLYAFTLHVCAYGNNAFNYAFMKGESLLLSGREYESGGSTPCTSVTVHTEMKAGEAVYIKNWSGGSHTQIYTSNSRFWNSFSGNLIHK